jgi:hypothetical protein
MKMNRFSELQSRGKSLRTLVARPTFWTDFNYIQ